MILNVQFYSTNLIDLYEFNHHNKNKEIPYLKNVEIEVELNDSIETLKARIQDKEGTPPDQQMLFFNEKQLEDNKNVSNYNLNNKDTLILIFRVRGGAHIDNILKAEMENNKNKSIGFDIKLLKRDELYVNLIHFDVNMTNGENYKYFNKFKNDVVGGFHAIDDLNILKKYLEKIKPKKIPFILISSGRSGQEVIPLCIKYSFIKEIIIFCFNYEKHKHYIKDYPKYVKKVFTDINSVYAYIKTFYNKNKNYKNEFNKKHAKDTYSFSSEEIDMDKQIQQCPLITSSEYDNCYFLIHRTFAHFFDDMDDKSKAAYFRTGNLHNISELLFKMEFNNIQDQDNLRNKFS